MKKILLILLSVAVLAVSLTGCGSSGKKNQSVKQFVSHYISDINHEKSFDHIAKHVYPKSYIKELKKTSLWNEVSDSYDNTLKNYKTKGKNAKQLAKFDKDQLRELETAISRQFDCEVKITKGYEYSYDTILEYNGTQTIQNCKMCVVYIKNDGWKAIRGSYDELCY